MTYGSTHIEEKTTTGKKTQKIASAVNLVARLPEGDCFVFILGAGNESPNLETLANWIEGLPGLRSNPQCRPDNLRVWFQWFYH